MIQDIFPKHMFNQYQNREPENGDAVFYFHEHEMLAKVENDTLIIPTYEEYTKEKYIFYYLFAIDQTPYFIALERMNLDGELQETDLYQKYEFKPVNLFRTAGPKDLSFAAITAYHLNCWYRDNRICGRCGRPMVHDTKERMMHCDCCNNMVYPKICPAVIVAVKNKDKVLLTKYAGRDYTKYALIAGFAEIGETIEQTVEREVMEEVGLKVKNITYYKSQPWALSGTLLMGFFCDLDGDDKIVLQEDELSVGKWFTAKEMTMEPDDVSLTNEMMMKFKQEHM